MTPGDTPTACRLPAPGTIHVWQIDLQHPALLALGGRRLTDDESARARRFLYDQHRRRFMAGRSAMRLLLGRCSGRDPAAIRFDYGAHGKPSLPAGSTGPAVRFNFTNSDRRALLAVAVDREVGIDLESRGRDINLPGLVRHILNASEAAEFRALPEAVQRQALLTIWTRKEAWIKALGEGLSRSLQSFSVPVDPEVSEQVIPMPEAPGKTAEWTFLLLDSHPDDIATLTARGTDWTCRCLEWQPEETA
jgi:4'-phosphopantetheinyl transferase